MMHVEVSGEYLAAKVAVSETVLGTSARTAPEVEAIAVRDFACGCGKSEWIRKTKLEGQPLLLGRAE